MNAFVSISELMQNRKDKINSKEYFNRKIFIQFIWFASYDTNSRNSVYSKVIIFLIASDGCSSLSLKVKWVYSLQYLFYHLLYMARAVSRIWIHLLFFQCLILGVRNNIWDQTFCVIELSLQLDSRDEARRTQAL